MARGKKQGKNKAKASPGKNTPHRAPYKRHSSQSWQVRDEAVASKFSLQDEARWASNHRTAAYEAGKNLRHMPPIQFISAGHLEGTLKKIVPAVESTQVETPESSAESFTPSSPLSTPDNTNAMAHMVIRSPSPALSEASSSADEVLFRGRGNQAQVTTVAPVTVIATATKQTITTQDTVDGPENPVVSVAAPEPEQTLPDQTKNAPVPEKVEQVELEVDSDADEIVEKQFEKRRGGKPRWEGTTTEWEHRSKPNIGWLPTKKRPDMKSFLSGKANSRDAAMEDYLQNVEDFGLTDDPLAASGFANREMDLDGGSHNDWVSTSEAAEDANRAAEDENEAAEDSGDWESDMLQDFDNLSTSSDLEDTVVRILSKRIRKSGLQYLCVYEGSVIDEARWLPATFLRATAEKKLEELGLGGDEVLLYGDDEFFDGPVKDRSFIPFSRSNKKCQDRRGRGKRDPSFPSATAMADALDMDPYSGFDVMDTERPSLKPKKKGRRGQPPPELDDSDLNEQLQNAWAADRVKKRLKKAEREELRQQGLLGRKGKSANLKVKYQGGIEMEDIVEELREFMLGTMETLSLPPMDAYRRATIHQVAAFFNLNSRSRGDGMDRFTLLSKTTRTRTLTDDEFNIAIQKKGFQKRLRGPLYTEGSGGRAGKFSTVKHKHGGVRARPQLGYKDGETVGANAPELGPENKGHALMMKMGWAKGDALGAGDNKGILQPIPHTVKTNKAGLQ
ncbi:R3H multi-domain protein [Pyrenophora tritici-repentis]|nr:Single-stranded nucleic acid binding R3H [Pyrenophora tritici-repentis]PZC94457.1 R3H multi-domain protein [Pyrenophora tritici-repentis]PZD42026.1 R3H multi-domain protein [Pyrenophora tritici-repentis]